MCLQLRLCGIIVTSLFLLSCFGLQYRKCWFCDVLFFSYAINTLCSQAVIVFVFVAHLALYLFCKYMHLIGENAFLRFLRSNIFYSLTVLVFIVGFIINLVFGLVLSLIFGLVVSIFCGCFICLLSRQQASLYSRATHHSNLYGMNSLNHTI